MEPTDTTQSTTEAAPDTNSTQGVSLVTPTHAEIAAISGVLLSPLGPAPDEYGMVKTIMVTHPGTNKATITTDLVEAMAWLAQALDNASIARYEVVVQPFLLTEYNKLTEDTTFGDKVTGVKLLSPGDLARGAE